MARSSGSSEGSRSRGFAAMDRERQREIASKGGRAAHQQGAAHEFDSQEAREAGRRGGQVVSRNRQHMAEIGARGGQHSHGGRGQQAGAPTAPAVDTAAAGAQDEGVAHSE